MPAPPYPVPAPNSALTVAEVCAAVAEVMRPGHFFVGGGASAAWEHMPREETPWEVFRGRLLDPAHTRERRAFATWNLFLGDGPERPAEAVLAVKLERDAPRLHVTRA